jgi:hypothetical protein
MALLPLSLSAQSERLSAPSEPAESHTDSVRTFIVRFPIGVGRLQERVGDNHASLIAFHDWLRQAVADSTLTRVQFGGFASPEGPTALNRKLVSQRAASLRQWTVARLPITPFLLPTEARGTLYDWMTMRHIVENSTRADKEEILSVLRQGSQAEDIDAACIAGLRSLHHGDSWRWLQTHAFPQMRNAYALVATTAEPMEEAEETAPNLLTQDEATPSPEPTATTESEEAAEAQLPATVPPMAGYRDVLQPAKDDTHTPFFMDVRTNLLYDVALIPNLGLELSLGHHWSLGTNWAWAWWSRNRSHRYWRVFGGELNLRKWFGAEKPLTGHHVGVYAEALTYDVMLSSSKGYLSGVPGGSMTRHPSWNVGAEYGFALPIGRRLNLDMTLGVGYFRSTYYEYTPVDVHYVWQATKKKRWIGPTKAEVSLVWLLGRGNVNAKKGGVR